MVRKISANYIFQVSSPPIKNGVVLVDDNGFIIDVLDTTQDASLQTLNSEHHNNIEFHEGIICPGFVNTHCHLELSYLKGKIKEKIGIAGFIKEMLAKRTAFSETEIMRAIIDAEGEMLKNGIVAVGDISNNTSTFNQKKIGNLMYHTFFEIFDLHPDNAIKNFESANEQIKIYTENNSSFPISITPHAPYTVSEKLLKLLSDKANKDNSILTIHNQESEAESDLFINKSGKIADLFNEMGIKMDDFKPTGFNSLRYSLSHLPKHNKILLVHNTYTSKADIQWAHKSNSQIYWCFCPNANLYIENKLPDFQSFIDEKSRITIGTDSLASNWSLSVLEELKTISRYTPQISLETLIGWATKNGAEFLGFDKQLGTIEKGKCPGLNLIKNLDLNYFKLTGKSEIEVIL